MRGLVLGTSNLEKTCFSAPRMTPSLHLTPTIVLIYRSGTKQFRRLWQRIRVGGFDPPECRWYSLGRTGSFKRFLNYYNINLCPITLPPSSTHHIILLLLHFDSHSTIIFPLNLPQLLDKFSSSIATSVWPERTEAILYWLHNCISAASFLRPFLKVSLKYLFEGLLSA